MNDRVTYEYKLVQIPLQYAVVPDWVQVLGLDPPETRYPEEQEYEQRDPTYVELLQDTPPWDGADGVDVQRTTFN